MSMDVVRARWDKHFGIFSAFLRTIRESYYGGSSSHSNNDPTKECGVRFRSLSLHSDLRSRRFKHQTNRSNVLWVAVDTVVITEALSFHQIYNFS